MTRYILLALNGPTGGEGDEAAYNQWYREVHVPDLLAVEGVTSARRYKVVQTDTGAPYVAAYEIETNDLQAVLEAMPRDMRPFPPSFDKANSRHVLAVEMDE